MEEQNVQEVVKNKPGRKKGYRWTEEMRNKSKATRARKRAEKEVLVQNDAGNGGSPS